AITRRKPSPEHGANPGAVELTMSLHIVLANRWYPTEGGYGGVGVYNRILAHALCELGHRVTVVTRGRDRRLRRYGDGAVHVHALPTRQTPRLLQLLSPWR